VSLTRLARAARAARSRGDPRLRWIENYSYMLRASLIAYMVGTAFLGLSYWDLLYHLIFIAVLVKKFALEDLEKNRKDAPARPATLTQPARAQFQGGFGSFRAFSRLPSRSSPGGPAIGCLPRHG